MEIAEKSGEDLMLTGLHDEVFTVAKLQGGYLRQFGPFASLVPGVGAALSVSIVPDRVRSFFDGRSSVGFSVFFNLRPAEMSMGMGHEMHGATSSAPLATPSAASNATAKVRP